VRPPAPAGAGFTCIGSGARGDPFTMASHSDTRRRRGGFFLTSLAEMADRMERT
jgi:hypothetical protein